MAVYRRQVLLAQWRPRVLVFLLAVAMYPVAANPWVSSRPYDQSLHFASSSLVSSSFVPGAAELERGVDARRAVDSLRPELARVDGAPSTSEPQKLAEGLPVVAGAGLVKFAGAGYATMTNVAIAISFIDGMVIEPGAKFSFDDAARTWDYKEDRRYIPGPATSSRGPITMRGGGVCYLSTALWRAALAAGLATDARENHFGLVSGLGGGLDATNTLVIRNDSHAPVTVRAWMDLNEVYVALYADEPLGRSGSMRGPERLSSGRYVAYQDITWADGRTTTKEFVSRYSW